MNTPSKEWWDGARRARDQIVARFLTHPDVSLIDIGLDPQGASGTPVLRVHLRQGDGSTLNIPDEIGGIPVRVIRGDYEPQSGSTDP
jgi:hypothetical protein